MTRGEWKGLDTGRMPVFLGYDQTERMIAALLDRAAQWQPEAVVGIARGGLVPATMARRQAVAVFCWSMTAAAPAAPWIRCAPRCCMKGATA